jgi:hypothetical protein
MSVVDDFEHVSMVVVYDPSDGHPVHSHTHYYVALNGGKPLDERQLEHKASEFIAAHKRPVDRLAFLHVEPGEIKPDAMYKVEAGKLQLIDVPRPERQK